MAIAAGGSLVAKAYVQIRTDLAPLRSGLSEAISLVRQSVSTMAGVTAGALAAAGLEAGLSGAVSLAKSIVGEMIGVNAQFEQFEVSLGVLFKSERVAKQMIQDIQQMAARTPFRMADLTQGVTMLKVFGFQVKDLLPMMRLIGDAASASPRGMEDGIQRISYAFGQMHTAGVVNARHLRMLTEAAVPAWEILAQKMRKTTAQVRADVTAKNISAAQAIPMILAGIGERFGGMMEKQNRTWKGLMSNLLDDTQFFLKDVGKEFFKLSEIRLAKLIDWYEGSSEAKNFKEQITQIINVASQWLDRKFTQAWDWLRSPDARKFGVQIADIAKQAWSIAKVGATGAWAFLHSKDAATLAEFVAAIARTLWRISSITFTHAMAFLRGDTFASIVRYAQGMGEELWRIANLGFDQIRDVINSDNFAMMSEEAKKLGRVLLNVFVIVKDFAGDQITKGFAWLRSENAAQFGIALKSIGTELVRIAGITFTNVLEFLKSDRVAQIASDLWTAAQSLTRVASIKFVAIMDWLKTSEEASKLADALSWIAKNLSWIVQNLGPLAVGIAAMSELAPILTGIGAAFDVIVAAIAGGGLLAMLSPGGVIALGIAAIGTAMVAAKLEGRTFGDELCLIFDRLTSRITGTKTAVTKLQEQIKREKEFNKRNSHLDEPGSEENVAQLKEDRIAATKVLEDAKKTEAQAANDFAEKQRTMPPGLKGSRHEQEELSPTRDRLAAARTDRLVAQRAIQRIDKEIAERQEVINKANARKELEADYDRRKKAFETVMQLAPTSGLASTIKDGANIDSEHREGGGAKWRGRMLFKTAEQFDAEQRRRARQPLVMGPGGAADNRDRRDIYEDNKKQRREEYEAGKKQRRAEYLAGIEARKPGGDVAKNDDGLDPGGVKKKTGHGLEQTGVVAFAQQLQASLNKTEAEQATIDTNALLGGVIEKNKGIKIANFPKPDVARTS